MEYFKIKILKDELENVLNEMSYLYPQRRRNKKTKYEIKQQKVESKKSAEERMLPSIVKNSPIWIRLK